MFAVRFQGLYSNYKVSIIRLARFWANLVGVKLQFLFTVYQYNLEIASGQTNIAIKAIICVKTWGNALNLRWLVRFVILQCLFL